MINCQQFGIKTSDSDTFFYVIFLKNNKDKGQCKFNKLKNVFFYYSNNNDNHNHNKIINYSRNAFGKYHYQYY